MAPLRGRLAPGARAKNATSSLQSSAENHPSTTTDTTPPLHRPTNDRKRRRSSSSPSGPDNNADKAFNLPQLSIHKRRQPLKADATPLDILAHAASARPRAPISSRPVLLNPPLGSPFFQPSTTSTPFNILTRLLSHVDILLNITSYLPPQTLLNLYSISAPFHYLMDSHFTSFILSSMRVWAPDAAVIFPWWCFRQFCIEDPALRRSGSVVEKRSLSWTDGRSNPHTTIWEALEATERENEGEVRGKRQVSDEHRRAVAAAAAAAAKEGEVKGRSGKGDGKAWVKAVPSFRWLKMVVWREMVSREIVGWMAAHGHRMPRDDTVEAVKRMWFLMDMPVNAPRVALIHNTAYFTPKTLFMLQTFFIKLDMLYTDPIHSFGGESTMREFLLAERSLSTLWNYLRGADGTTRLDVLRLWVRHGYRRPMPVMPMTRIQHVDYERKKNMPILGVPAKLVGRWSYECWGLGRDKIMRPDELVLKEGVRRRLDMQRFYLRMIASGFLDHKLQAIPDAKPDEVVLSLIRRRKNREQKARGRREKNGGDVTMKEERDDDEDEDEDEDEFVDEYESIGPLMSRMNVLG